LALGFAVGGFLGFPDFQGFPLAQDVVVEADFVGFDGEFGDGGDHGAGVVEFDFFDGFEGVGAGFGEIQGRDLHGVEEQAGSFGVETAVGDALRD
jgi:hypothetical protein